MKKDIEHITNYMNSRKSDKEIMIEYFKQEEQKRIDKIRMEREAGREKQNTVVRKGLLAKLNDIVGDKESDKKVF